MFDRVDCGGPMRGMAFPYYDGPLKGQLQNRCFVCGHKPDAVAVATKGGGRVGVCKKHLEFLSTYTRPGEKPPFITHVHVPVVT